MFILNKNEIQFLWDKQIPIMAARKPSWILSSIIGVSIFIFMEVLILLPSRERLFSILYIDLIACIPYVLFAISIYIYLLVSSRKKKGVYGNPYLTAWLYGANDMSAMTLFTVLMLNIGLLSLEISGLDTAILNIGTIIFLASYLVTIPISWTLAPYSIKRQIATDRPVTPYELRLAMAIPSFLVAMGVMIGQLLSRTGQSQVAPMLVGGIFTVMSFVLMAIGMAGLYRLISMALHGFHEQKASSMEIPPTPPITGISES